MPRVLLIFAISVSFLFGLTACRQSKINNNAAPPENLDNKSSKNFLISLERTGCYGTCPSYTLVILSDGTIIFSSPTYFVDDGKKLVPKSLRPIVSKLSESQLKQLTDAFEKANYFALKDKYLDATDGGCPDLGNR